MFTDKLLPQAKALTPVNRAMLKLADGDRATLLNAINARTLGLRFIEKKVLWNTCIWDYC